jgi:hypothetical protein
LLVVHNSHISVGDRLIFCSSFELNYDLRNCFPILLCFSSLLAILLVRCCSSKGTCQP